MALGYAWTLTRDNIINAALRKIGVIGIGETAEAEMITNGALALNGLLKEWSGIHSAPWRVTNASLTTTASQNYVSLTGTTYSMAILKAIISTSSTRNIVKELNLVESHDFLEYLNQTSETGEPTIGWASVESGASLSKLYLYPIPDATYYIDVEFLRVLQDFGASGDNMQMSASWGSALIYGLAADLSHEYSCPMNERQALRGEAERTLKNAKLSTVERPTEQIRSGYY
jgi:hypothetical protein